MSHSDNQNVFLDVHDFKSISNGSFSLRILERNIVVVCYYFNCTILYCVSYICCICNEKKNVKEKRKSCDGDINGSFKRNTYLTTNGRCAI